MSSRTGSLKLGEHCFNVINESGYGGFDGRIVCLYVCENCHDASMPFWCDHVDVINHGLFEVFVVHLQCKLLLIDKRDGLADRSRDGGNCAAGHVLIFRLK